MKQHKDSPIFKRLRQPAVERDYFPTKHVVTRWFNIINREIFDNELKPFNNVFIQKMTGKNKGNWAFTLEFYELIKNKWEYVGVNLTMDNKFPCFHVFLVVLAHEMVHLFQADVLEDVIKFEDQHGPTFLAWKNDFEKHGLPLSEDY